VLALGCAHAPRKPGVAERRALASSAQEAREAGNFAACGARYAQAAAPFEAARCLARAGAIDDAFAQLTLAAKKGRAPLARYDAEPDFAALRSDARWSPLRAEAEGGIATLDAEITALYEADQAERRDPNADWDAVSKNDAARRQRVEALVSAGRARQAIDSVHAAMVFQHGDDVPTILKARDWAMKAVQLDPDDDHARWLVAASTDRALMYAGRPQRYGTQFSRDATTGQWVLWDVDPAVTDAERLEWAVPTLAAARAKVVELNRR
jgi:hypothetical protein